MTAGRLAHGPLPQALRLPVLVTAGFGLCTVIVLGAALAGASGPTVLDSWARAHSGDPAQVRSAALTLDFAGEPVGAALLVLLLATVSVWLHRPVTAMVLFVAAGSTVAITTALKHTVGRTIHDQPAFPSGHTGFLAAVALVAGILITDVRGYERAVGTAVMLGTATATAAAMGWAQVALDAHYATDTVGGFATALAVVPGVVICADAVSRWSGAPAAAVPPAQK